MHLPLMHLLSPHAQARVKVGATVPLLAAHNGVEMAFTLEEDKLTRKGGRSSAQDAHTSWPLAEAQLATDGPRLRALTSQPPGTGLLTTALWPLRAGLRPRGSCGPAQPWSLSGAPPKSVTDSRRVSSTQVATVSCCHIRASTRAGRARASIWTTSGRSMGHSAPLDSARARPLRLLGSPAAPLDSSTHPREQAGPLVGRPLARVRERVASSLADPAAFWLPRWKQIMQSMARNPKECAAMQEAVMRFAAQPAVFGIDPAVAERCAATFLSE